MDIETIKVKLRDAMKSHDWGYEYSDDYRCWKAGSEKRNIINSLFDQLRDHNRREAVLFWNMNAPASRQYEVPEE